MFKYSLPSFVKYLVPFCTWKVNTRDKVLFLTFDDGPHLTITPWVIEQLEKYNAKATFFCVGENVIKFPDTYKMLLSKGHIAGNHTFNHLNNCKTTNNNYFKNIEKAAEVINSKLFRPPYGRIRLTASYKLKTDYKIVMWSKLSKDYDVNLNQNESLKHMLKSVAGDVLVFHDSEKSFANLQFLLPKILEHFSKLGFTFKALTY